MRVSGGLSSLVKSVPGENLTVPFFFQFSFTFKLGFLTFLNLSLDFSTLFFLFVGEVSTSISTAPISVDVAVKSALAGTSLLSAVSMEEGTFELLRPLPLALPLPLDLDLALKLSLPLKRSGFLKVSSVCELSLIMVSPVVLISGIKLSFAVLPSSDSFLSSIVCLIASSAVVWISESSMSFAMLSSSDSPMSTVGCNWNGGLLKAEKFNKDVGSGCGSNSISILIGTIASSSNILSCRSFSELNLSESLFIFSSEDKTFFALIVKSFIFSTRDETLFTLKGK